MPEGDKQYQLPNRKLPRIQSTFSPTLASVINQLAEAIEGLPEHRQIKVGKGLLMNENRSATIISMGATPSPLEKWYPFKLYQQDAVNKPLEVSVFYGTISGTVPVIKDGRGSGIGLRANGTPINVSLRDEALSAGQDADDIDEAGVLAGQPVVTAGEDGNGEYQIWLEYTPVDSCASDEATVYVGDADHPNEVVIGAVPIPDPPLPVNGDRLPPDEDENNGVMPLGTNSTGYVEIGRVTVENERITKINNSLTHSLMHTSCGVRHYFWGV